jgi:hypothetical protein
MMTVLALRQNTHQPRPTAQSCHRAMKQEPEPRSSSWYALANTDGSEICILEQHKI